ncbi:MAG TPA: hypothetical protein PKJ26_02065 [Candidatus Woesebacteria bacterium]|nr:hypothetical protein [Candidatus Woesebacteria bacterium]HNS65260.1 hypothetical protein [Candidatus Woesebacteria bacterium]
MKIIPAILTESRSVAISQIELANSDDRFDALQIDIIDGWFADNLTLTPADYADLEYGQLQLDFHLMTEEPLDYVFELLEHRENLPIRSVIAQIEKMSSQITFVDQLKKTGWKVGLSLDLFTPIESIETSVMGELDFVQVMAIEAGFQGQAFVTTIVDKIKELQGLRQKKSYQYELIVDGGIKKEEVALLQSLEVESVTIGSGLWKSVDFSQAVDTLFSVVRE